MQNIQKKKIRKKRTLSSFSETEAQLLEKLRKMQEEKKKYIFNMFREIFTEIMSDDELLQILDEIKDNEEFQDNISKLLKEEIVKYRNIEENLLKVEGNNEQYR